jgi:hypothetical protein
MIYSRLSTKYYRVVKIIMTKIGLISDTYMPGTAKEIPKQVAKVFQGADLILHAGNIYISPVLDELEKIAPVLATGSIKGNRTESPDFYSMECPGDPRVKEMQFLKFDGHSIGMVHDLHLAGLSADVMPGMTQRYLRPDQSMGHLTESFFGQKLDIVVFGRTLYSMVEEHDGILFVNPGSPSVPRNLVKLGSVALLTLTPEKREATIVELASVD